VGKKNNVSQLAAQYMSTQWRRKYFWKEGAEKIRRNAPKKIFIAPLGNFVGGADFRVGLVYWQWHLTK